MGSCSSCVAFVPSLSASLIQSPIDHRPRDAELYITRTKSYVVWHEITNTVRHNYSNYLHSLASGGTNLNLPLSSTVVIREIFDSDLIPIYLACEEHFQKKGYK